MRPEMKAKKQGAAKKQSIGASLRERIKARADKRKDHGSGGSNIFKTEVRSYEISAKKPKKFYMFDIIPYRVTVDNHPEVKKGDVWHQRTIWVHYVEVDADNSQPVICPKKTFGHKCPICEEEKRMSRDPNADPDALKRMRAKERELFNVIDKTDDSGEIMVLEQSYFNFGKLLEEEVREGDDEDVAAFASPDEGKTLKVRFSEETMGGSNKFLKASKIVFLDREEQYDEDIIDKAYNLDAIIKELPYEQIAKMFYGDDQAAAEEEEDEKPKRKGKPADDDDDDEADDDSDSDDSDEEADDEEVEDPADDDEEDEDESGDDDDADGDGDDDVEDEEVEDEDEEDEPPVKKKPKPDAKPAKKKCPAGGVFGADCDTLKHCKRCGLWDACDEAKNG